MDELWSPEGRQFQVRRIIGEAEYIAEDSPSGADYRPGIPDQFDWILVGRTGSGRDEQHQDLRPSPEKYDTEEKARQAVEDLKLKDPNLAHIPIVHFT
jgi:hypothetical protein